MKKLILVPLKRNDRAEDLMPYVEEIARPDMKAVFMVPYPVDGFRWSHGESAGIGLKDCSTPRYRPCARSSARAFHPSC
jgi:hypothetical protein